MAANDETLAWAFDFPAIEGGTLTLGAFQGRVLLVANIAFRFKSVLVGWRNALRYSALRGGGLVRFAEASDRSDMNWRIE